VHDTLSFRPSRAIAARQTFSTEPWKNAPSANSGS
jgi:hypothetical protein